jgi:hypothetical protein
VEKVKRSRACEPLPQPVPHPFYAAQQQMVQPYPGFPFPQAPGSFFPYPTGTPPPPNQPGPNSGGMGPRMVCVMMPPAQLRALTKGRPPVTAANWQARATRREEGTGAGQYRQSPQPDEEVPAPPMPYQHRGTVGGSGGGILGGQLGYYYLVGHSCFRAGSQSPQPHRAGVPVGVAATAGGDTPAAGAPHQDPAPEDEARQHPASQPGPVTQPTEEDPAAGRVDGGG